MQPVVDLRIARETSAKYFSLQLRQLDLLIRHRVIRSCAGLLERDLIVLPAYVAQCHSSRGRKVTFIQRPLAAAFELGDAFAQVVPARDRRGISEVNVRFVARVQVRIAESR